ncbi:MAG: hypothetical protein R3A79_20165 [Nannocystaceae bacterium]
MHTQRIRSSLPARSRARAEALRVALRGGAVGALLCVAACSGGPSETDASGSESDSTSSTSSTSTTGSSQTVTVTITTSPSSSTGETTSTSTTAGVACGGVEGFDCAEPVDCGEVECGGLGSHLDDEGCPRPTCADDSECADGERCYGALWGQCTASTFDCNDGGGSCSCGFSGDCGGNFCASAASFPATASAPSGVRMDGSCAPDDGPAVKIEFGISDGGCKTDLDPGWLRIDIWQSAPLAPGYYPLGELGGLVTLDGGATSTIGWVQIDSWADDLIGGSYAVIVGDNLYEGTLADVPYCYQSDPCG